MKSSTERIDQQANRCLFGTRAGIAHGVDFDDVHADEMTFGSYAFQQAVDFREAEAVGFQSSSAGSEGGIHYIHVEGDVDVSALRNLRQNPFNAFAMNLFPGDDGGVVLARIFHGFLIVGQATLPKLNYPYIR